ncbi:MAG: flagellar biosynthetic protein FliR [Chitinispirillaceae bacterium]
MNGLMVSADQVQYFLLMFVRVVTMIFLLPIFGAQNIPAQIKVALSLLFTTALFSTQLAVGFPQLPSTFSVGMFVLMVSKEAMVGLAVGFAASFLFAAVQFAGKLIDTEMGFGFVEMADPITDQSTTVLGQFQVVIFSIFFLLFNGHYFMLVSIQKSFELIPLMGATFPGDRMSAHILGMVADIFIIALKLAAPIFVTLLLTELALGIVARTVPQINIFFVGLPLKIFVGIGTTIIALPMLATLFKRMVEALVQDIWKLLYLMS